MVNYKKFTFALLLLIITLILREIPYINILVVRELWVFYLILLFLLIFPLSPRRLSLLVIFLFLTALFFSFLKLTYFSELAGVTIYFLLWLVVGLRIKEFFKKTRG